MSEAVQVTDKNIGRAKNLTRMFYAHFTVSIPAPWLKNMLSESRSSTYFGKGEALPWTAYMEECCKVLEEEKESPDDELLILLARLQLIVEKAMKSPWHDPNGDMTVERPPATFYIKALEAQIQNFKRSVPQKLQQSGKSVLIGFECSDICSRSASSRNILH